LSGLAERFNDIKEQKYASNIKEPLGQSYQRNYNWPTTVRPVTATTTTSNKENFAFGVPTIGSESTKDVLYIKDGSKEERPEISKMYKKTHGNFGPGEQRERDY